MTEVAVNSLVEPVVSGNWVEARNIAKDRKNNEERWTNASIKKKTSKYSYLKRQKGSRSKYKSISISLDHSVKQLYFIHKFIKLYLLTFMPSLLRVNSMKLALDV